MRFFLSANKNINERHFFLGQLFLCSPVERTEKRKKTDDEIILVSFYFFFVFHLSLCRHHWCHSMLTIFAEKAWSNSSLSLTFFSVSILLLSSPSLLCSWICFTFHWIRTRNTNQTKDSMWCIDILKYIAYLSSSKILTTNEFFFSHFNRPWNCDSQVATQLFQNNGLKNEIWKIPSRADVPNRNSLLLSIESHSIIKERNRKSTWKQIQTLKLIMTEKTMSMTKKSNRIAYAKSN